MRGVFLKYKTTCSFRCNDLDANGRCFCSLDLPSLGAAPVFFTHSTNWRLCRSFHPGQVMGNKCYFNWLILYTLRLWTSKLTKTYIIKCTHEKFNLYFDLPHVNFAKSYSENIDIFLDLHHVNFPKIYSLSVPHQRGIHNRNANLKCAGNLLCVLVRPIHWSPAPPSRAPFNKIVDGNNVILHIMGSWNILVVPM